MGLVMQKLIFVIGATAMGKTYFIDQNYKDKEVALKRNRDVLEILKWDKNTYF